MVKFTGFFKKISFALFSPDKLTISFVFADKKAATKRQRSCDGLIENLILISYSTIICTLRHSSFGQPLLSPMAFSSLIEKSSMPCFFKNATTLFRRHFAELEVL